MTKADEMRKMAAQNKKTKTEKVDDYEETLNKTYAKFICTVEDSANKGISKGYAAEIPRMLVPGKYTFEWKNKGLFTDYYVAKLTSLGERFLKDFKAKAEKDAANVPAEKKGSPEIKPEITIEDFEKIDLRVGEVVACEKHPKADKLLVFQVRIGDEVRQIVSGVAKYYKPEEMPGKHVIVVANLKSIRLRGQESRGMILFADSGERLEIVTTEAPDGNQVK